jgi:hypothetical protein
MPPPKPRKYYPAWVKLKRDKVIKIAAHPAFHARILKAVIKEKDMDVMYKYEMSEACRRAVISYTKNASELTIKLNISVDTSIGIADFGTSVTK